MVRTKRHTRRSAFTLLEVMLVIGLLALLAVSVIPALSRKGEKAKIDLTRAAVGPNGTISQEIRAFQFDTGRWPETLKDLVERPSDPEIAEKWNGPYIENPEHMKDAWGQDFNFQSGDSARHNESKFDLWSVGPDGRDGTDDDITNWPRD